MAIALRPSLQVMCYAGICHLLAAAGLLASALPPFPAVLGLLLLAGHLYLWRRRYLRRMPRALYCEGERWYVAIGGRKCPFTLEGEQVVWPRLVVLRGRLATRRQCVLVLPGDAADARDLRRLRVLLRGL